MSWKDNLRPASFRGIEFYIDSSTKPTGRRVQLREFPNRDIPYAEDLGAVSEIRRITGFVIGDNYHIQRDKLDNALRKKGQAQLIHPWLGIFNVVAGESSFTESRREGGMARFEMTFYPADEPQTYPATTVNTGQLISLASSALQVESLSTFNRIMHGVNAGLVNLRAFRQAITNAYNIAAEKLEFITEGIADLNEFADIILNEPQRIIENVKTYLNTVLDADLFANKQSSYGDSLISINNYISDSQVLFSKSVVAGSETAVASDAVNSLIEDILIINLGEEAADMPIAPILLKYNSTASVDEQVINPVKRPDVPVANDVIDTRNAISDMIWNACQRASPDHYITLNNYRQRITEHLTMVADSGIRLEVITPLNITSSLVLAYKRFGDATRHKEIEQRNNITHRNFINPNPLQIARVTDD